MNSIDVLIDVPWGHIAGRWYGNRKVRPILALHGWQDNLGTWRRLLPLFPQHIGVLCIDLPGHGRSSGYPNGMIYHMNDYVGIIWRIVKHFNWEKVSLLGHSLGGILCFTYAALYPQTVDMLIQLDIIVTPTRSPNYMLQLLKAATEKTFNENERLEKAPTTEPVLYTFEELEEKLHLASKKSINKENCQYILKRNIQASSKNSTKYFFSRDARIKYYHEFNPSMELILEMANRLKDINYLIVKSKDSNYIENNLLENLRKIVKNVVIVEVEGTHHVHLNEPEIVADKIIPFIMRTMSSTEAKNKSAVYVCSSSKL